MLGAIYTSLSGMNAFRSGLDSISNNVANMNTPGYKLSDPLFRDLVYQYGGTLGNGHSSVQTKGSGVHAQQGSLSMEQGELQDTGNSLDAAISGTGFFVLELDGRRVYTRAGRFEFNSDGILVERGTGARVLVNTATSQATYFDLNEHRTFAPQATTEVKLSGVLARGTTSTTYTLPQITVIDTEGAKQTVSARFTPDTADRLHWTVEILDKDNAVIGTGDIRFNENGTPAEGGNTMTATVDPADTPPFTVTFNFGTADRHNGITSITGTATSQLQMLHQDGIQLGTITKTEFDEKGQIKITYSNNEDETPATLVLAQFDTPDQLKSTGGSHFDAVGDITPSLGTALHGAMGSIAGGQLEMSNVDLTNQFAGLIIAQRGFQGSSQVASVANEMLQQLMNINGGR